MFARHLKAIRRRAKSRLSQFDHFDQPAAQWCVVRGFDHTGLVKAGVSVPPHHQLPLVPLGDVVAQLVERQPRDPMDSLTRGSNPVRSTRKICEIFFPVKMLC